MSGVSEGNWVMELRLNGKQSVYLDIVEQYEKYISIGALKAGDKLPSCRGLAMELGINPNTVERAYAELEKLGYIQLIQKKGAFVVDMVNSDEKLFIEAEKQIKLLKNSGMKKDKLIEIVGFIYGEEPKL